MLKSFPEQACKKKILVGGKSWKNPSSLPHFSWRCVRTPQQLSACNSHGIIGSTIICIVGFALPHFISFLCDCEDWGVGYFSLQRPIFRPLLIFSFLHTFNLGTIVHSRALKFVSLYVLCTRQFWVQPKGPCVTVPVQTQLSLKTFMIWYFNKTEQTKETNKQTYKSMYF